MSNNSTSSLRRENNDPSLFNLPALPPSLSESLTSGTSIPAPPPSPPPPNLTPFTTPEKSKSFLKRPITPPKIPFASPPPSMPGAFPTSPTPSPKLEPQTPQAPQTPQTFGKATYTASAYATSPIQASATAPNSKSPKRPGSLRNLLSFKRAHTASPDLNASPASPRPGSAGGFSLASSLRPTLSGRKSGSFWTRRKSSLGMHTNGTAQDSPSSPDPKPEHDTVYEDEVEHKSPLASPDHDSPTLNKRRSMTFWRRKSSLALLTDAQKQYLDNGVDTPTPTTTQQQKYESPGERELENRSWSPPPILPEVVKAKDGGFLDVEDMFRDIGS